MRVIAALCFVMLFAAPDLSRAPLTAADAARFVAIAEAIAVEAAARSLSAGPTTGIATALPTPAAGLPPLSDMAPPVREARAVVLDRHGVAAAEWEDLSRRVWAAYRAQRLAPLAQALGRGARIDQNGLSPAEQGERSVLLNATRGDVAFILAETAADRSAIAPYLPRLARLAGD
ncbi:MAG: hypothetical protein RLY86_4143 [Pseudomonadota bacterium]|jgi:hypothetical protein